MMFEEKFLAAVRKFDLINKNDSILVALSGGADSVSLLLMLTKIRDEFALNIEAAHINHMIRAEAEHDEEFARRLCKKLNVIFHSVKVNIPQISKQMHYSEEKAGRIARYDFFDKVINERNFKIATAHTKDDSAENFLISAIRGTSPMGIPPKRGKIIRPLCEITKKEIYDFLLKNNQTFVEDKTNFETDYTRNKVRIQLIPYINEKFDTDFTKVIYNNLEVNYFENDYIQSETKKAISEICSFKNDSANINIKEFNNLHIALKSRVIREVYYSLNHEGFISFFHVEKIIQLASNNLTGKIVELCDNTEAVISYEKLIIKRKSGKFGDFEYKAKIDEKIYIQELSCNVFINTQRKGKVFYSADNEFILRNRRDGDRIYIQNVGHKKLKSFFIDKKVDKNSRDKLIIVSGIHGINFVEGLYFQRKSDIAVNKYYLYIGD